MLGKIIKYIRKEKEISQEDLGQILNVDQTTISGYERNYREPDFQMLEKICKICDYEIIFKNKINGKEITTKNIERKEI